SCGDAVVDPGEDCDAGSFPSGTCCSSACTFVPSGTECYDGSVCMYSTCDGAGSCVAPTCQQASASRVLAKNALYLDQGRLNWQWRSSAAVDVAAFGDPSATTGITLCTLYGDGLGHSYTVPAATICPPLEHPCWRSTSNGLTYSSKGKMFPPDNIN